MKSTIIMFREIGFKYFYAKENKIIFSDGEELEGNENARIIFDLENKRVSSNIIYHSNIKKINSLIEHFKKELGWE